MKYPAHTVSQPLDSRQAKRVAKAIEEDKSISNPQYIAAIRRIVKAKKAQQSAGQTPKI